MNALFHAHSGLRYLVLLAGLVAAVAFAYGLLARRPVRAARALTAAFTGLLDLQILLGLGLVIGGVFYGALVGHLVTMLLAAAAAHGSSVMARRATDERRALTIRLVGVILTLVFIAVGITAIGRGVFGSAPPTPPHA
jgi:hypothetical protein